MAAPALTDLPEELATYFVWRKHPGLCKIIDALCTDNKNSTAQIKAMYVGGCVRDSLRGHPPQPGQRDAHTDIDIATVLAPDETMSALRRAGIKAIPTGYDHGTVTAVVDGVVAEITSLRADLETDGRHAVVAYSKDWDQDWRRRDFTVNAIYLTPAGKIFDPAGGRAGLAAKWLVFIGDPAIRIREDYLRILRFYRFSARFAIVMDVAGRQACKDLRGGLAQVSAERIGQELLKILAGPALPMVLTAMAEDGILSTIMEGPADLALALQLAALAEGARMRLAPELLLAALWPKLGPRPEPEAGEIDLDQRLRLSGQQSAKRRKALVAATLFAPLPGQSGLREALYRLKEEAYKDGLLLAWAKQTGQGLSVDETQKWQQALSLPAHWPVPTCPITGKGLVARGMKPGPALGAALAQAERDWVAAGYPVDAGKIEQIIEMCLQVGAARAADLPPGGAA